MFLLPLRSECGHKQADRGSSRDHTGPGGDIWRHGVGHRVSTISPSHSSSPPHAGGVVCPRWGGDMTPCLNCTRPAGFVCCVVTL